MSVNLNVPIDVLVTSLIESLSEEEIVSFIKDLEISCANFELTKQLADYFANEVIEEVRRESLV